VFSQFQIEKTVKREPLSSADNQEKFKTRYTELCGELTEYLTNLKDTEDDEEYYEEADSFEWHLGDICVYLDSGKRTVLDLMKEENGL